MRDIPVRVQVPLRDCAVSSGMQYSILSENFRRDGECRREQEREGVI